MANEAMRAQWDGEEGEHWAAFADRYEAAAARNAAAFLPAVGVTDGEAVLDIGCGAGGIALAVAARTPRGRVLAVDLSSQELGVAAKRAAAAGVSNVAFEQAAAQTYAFEPEEFDVAISSFGVMFFDDPVAAFRNIATALKPRGRIAFMVWRHLQENEWLMGVRDTLAMGRQLPVPPLEVPSPFALADPDRTRRLLSDAGFVNVELMPLDEPMIPGADADDAFSFVSNLGIAKGLIQDLDESQKAQALSNLHQYLADHETPEGVHVPTAAWIITARKP